MKYKLLFFDLDGTLVDSLQDITDSINQTKIFFNQPELSREAVRDCIGRGSWYLIQKAFDLWDDKKVNEVYQVYWDHYTKNYTNSTYIYQNVESTLAQLPTVNLVYTNKPLFFAQKTVKHLGLERYFSKIIAPETYQVKKPDPLAIIKTSDEMNIPLTHMMMIGDSRYDIECGQNAAVKTCAVSYGFGNPQEIRQADFLIDDFSQLIDLIL